MPLPLPFITWNHGLKRGQGRRTEVDFKLGFLAFCIRNYMLTMKYSLDRRKEGQNLQNLKANDDQDDQGESQSEMYKS